MTTPYRLAARLYFESGWSPIPLPFEAKSPVPDKPKVTGVPGVYVTEEVLNGWLAPKGRAQAGKLSYPPSNIALRLPPTVLGIDVDAYGEKAGERTLERAEADWGALPPTWVSTSRTDGVSGIRLFRIPPGLKWPGELPQGKGVELIRWDHRYAIVAPSVHDKTKEEYRWYLETETDDGTIVMVRSEDDFPDAPPKAAEGERVGSGEGPEGDIPWLPKEWVEGLTNGEAFVRRGDDEDLSASAVQDWLQERPNPANPCAHMRKMSSRWSVAVQKASDDGGAHDEIRDAVWGVLNDAAQGHSGVIRVLKTLRNVFLKAVEGRRPDPGAAKSEWARIVTRGVSKIEGDENELEEEDPCDAISKPSKAPPPKEGDEGEVFDIIGDPGPLRSKDVVWDFDQFGNSARLLRVVNGRARWVPGLEQWMLWDGMRWRRDHNGQISRWYTKAVNQIQEEGAFAGGEDKKEKEANALKFRRWMSVSRKVSEQEGAIKHARGKKGISIQPEEFDARPDLLNVPNGTVELKRDGVGFYRVHRPEDMLSLVSGAKYDSEARSAHWESFLERAIPDPEVQAWVQKMVGLSLYGVNEERLFVAVFGPSSTGKSTFSEALRRTLGDYAASVNLSLFRDNQDERPRPDLVRALSKRFIFAEEASASWHLHPDQVKRLTGNTAITARLPHKGEYLERVPAFTPWLFTNSAPSIVDADVAFWRRLRVVPFEQVIEDGAEVADYSDLLDTEESRAAILRWALDGYAAYRLDRRTAQPPSTWAALNRFKSQVSDFDLFLSECCVIGEEEWSLGRDLYAVYVEWSENKNIKPESEVKFAKFLNGRGFEKKAKRIDGAPQRPRFGIALSTSWRVDADK